MRRHPLDQVNEAHGTDKGRDAERYWKWLPYQFQATVELFGYIAYDDILIFDERGDPEHTDPHILLDFGADGPFRYVSGVLSQGRHVLNDDEIKKLKRKQIFPEEFAKPAKREIHKVTDLGLNAETIWKLQNLRGAGTLCAYEERLTALAVGSIIYIPAKDDRHPEKHAEVTHIYGTTVGAVRNKFSRDYDVRGPYLDHVDGNGPEDNIKVAVYELHEVMVLADNQVMYLGGD